MTDDIVTRLRESITNGHGIWDGDAKEAADEIERLQEQIQTVNLEWRDLIDQTQEKAFAEIERLRKAINSLLINIDDAHDNVGKYGLCITCDVADGSWPCVHRIALDELKEAVRGE